MGIVDGDFQMEGKECKDIKEDPCRIDEGTSAQGRRLCQTDGSEEERFAEIA